MKHFFVESSAIKDGYAYIDGIDVNHIRNVLRMSIGDRLMISDGEGNDYVCEITELTNEEVKLKITADECEGTELKTKLILFQGLPKSDKMELIIQKAVELGAFEIVPVTMKRCVMKLDEKKAANKLNRWQMIATSAAKQSRRGIIPQVSNLMTYKNAIKYARTMDIVIIPYENYNDMATANLISDYPIGSTIGIFIGPEGGFEENEVQIAIEAGFKPISLGRRILRTETAGMTVLSALMISEEMRNI